MKNVCFYNFGVIQLLNGQFLIGKTMIADLMKTVYFSFDLKYKNKHNKCFFLISVRMPWRNFRLKFQIFINNVIDNLITMK